MARHNTALEDVISRVALEYDRRTTANQADMPAARQRVTSKRVESRVLTDEYWQRVEALAPERGLQPGKTYLREPGAGRPPKPARKVMASICSALALD